jgi:hypothetical protein
MVGLNPFVELFEHPVATLTALAYAVVLLGVSIWLAGVGWRATAETRNYIHYRYTDHDYGPEWDIVPPFRLVLLAGGVCVLAAVELLLIGGIIHVLT